MQALARIKRRLNQIRPNRTQAIPVDVLTGYAYWAAHYPATAHNPLMEIEQQAMLNLLPEVSDRTCLDLACGSGRYLRWLQTFGAESAVGLDYSAEMLKQASRPPTVDRLPPALTRSLFLALPFPNELFEVIVCGLGVGHEKNLEGILTEVARILRPGGVLVYSDFHPFGALAGWQRTFTVDGTIFELEHYVHLYADHLQACRNAGLAIDAMVEPSAGEHAPPGFEETPVVLAIKAVKRAI